MAPLLEWLAAAAALAARREASPDARSTLPPPLHQPALVLPCRAHAGAVATGSGARGRARRSHRMHGSSAHRNTTTATALDRTSAATT